MEIVYKVVQREGRKLRSIEDRDGEPFFVYKPGETHTPEFGCFFAYACPDEAREATIWLSGQEVWECQAEVKFRTFHRKPEDAALYLNLIPCTFYARQYRDGLEERLRYFWEHEVPNRTGLKFTQYRNPTSLMYSLNDLTQVVQKILFCSSIKLVKKITG